MKFDDLIDRLTSAKPLAMIIKGKIRKAALSR